MADRRLRQSIAAEAARLIQQRKELDYYSARRKAARYARRERVTAEDLPSYGEIQNELFALEGLFAQERQITSLAEIRLAARELMTLLSDYQPLLSGSAILGPVLPGAEIELTLSAGDLSEVSAVLLEAGHRAELDAAGQLVLEHHFRCVVRWKTAGDGQPVIGTTYNIESSVSPYSLSLAELNDLIEADAVAAVEATPMGNDTADESEDGQDDAYHPDFFPILEVLLNKLEQVKQDPILHPEGDVLYHSLQVFEQLRAECPYDEELLLAGLLHDAGMALDRRHPVEAIWQAVGELITPRTWFFIQNRVEAVDYLNTGRIRGALRKSEDFEELVLLARADMKGRVRGAEVCTLEEALEYVAGLSSAWDDV